MRWKQLSKTPFHSRTVLLSQRQETANEAKHRGASEKNDQRRRVVNLQGDRQRRGCTSAHVAAVQNLVVGRRPSSRYNQKNSVRPHDSCLALGLLRRRRRTTTTTTWAKTPTERWNKRRARFNTTICERYTGHNVAIDDDDVGEERTTTGWRTMNERLVTSPSLTNRIIVIRIAPVALSIRSTTPAISHHTRRRLSQAFWTIRTAFCERRGVLGDPVVESVLW
ncbi:unnamed protein product [Heligmosomoides polygyrus]|uniref:Uncharacterized protein n=1 Tax=Heligmosomoides polygyrus TaxID=6339 RepID=A0A183FPA2_HELPZ|nr:unnamed protein product [Heligmosomoides polygyrus]